MSLAERTSSLDAIPLSTARVFIPNVLPNTISVVNLQHKEKQWLEDAKCHFPLIL